MTADEIAELRRAYDEFTDVIARGSPYPECIQKSNRWRGVAFKHMPALLTLASRAIPADRCEDCPPSGYPTDATRCDPCDRRALTVEEMPSAWQQRLKGRWHNLPEDWSKEECDRMPPGKVFRPLYAPDQLTRLCEQAKREAYAECAKLARSSGYYTLVADLPGSSCSGMHGEWRGKDGPAIADAIEALAEKKP